MKIRRRFRSSLVLTLIVTLLMTATVFAAGNTDWENNSITAEGFGAIPGNARSAGQAKALARRAAIVDAYRNLAEYAEGVNVDAETTVKDMAVESDVIKTKMTALVKGAKIVSEQMNPDGSYQVQMQIAMFGGTNSLAGAVLPATNAAEPFPIPAISSAVVAAKSAVTVPMVARFSADGGYTGLIVDCSGLGLQCVMSPVIFDAGEKPIYGHKNLDSATVINYGMASYSKDGVSNLARAGNNPLIVKAVSLAGHESNPIISLEDANRVLIENQATGFLQNCAVVFIR